MAKGQIAKTEIINKILSTFEGSFITAEGKEMRIPWTENGEQLEIKLAFTCAKDVLGSAGAATMKAEDVDNNFPLPAGTKIVAEVTEDEKANIKTLMETLGL